MTEQEHLLECLSEECSEVIKEVCKAQRFGLEDINPKTGVRNRTAISHELTDLIAVVDMLVDRGILVNDQLFNQNDIANKKAKVEHYIEYAKQHGRIT